MSGAPEVSYQESASGAEPKDLRGFFEGWPSPLSPETLLRILRGSDHVVLAVKRSNGAVVGFVTALSDGVLSARVPLLEVLPEYRGGGIGRELMDRMFKHPERLYMVDLVCDDPGLRDFYARLGMSPAFAMTVRPSAGRLTFRSHLTRKPGDPVFRDEVRSLVWHAPVEHEREHARFRDPGLVRMEHGVPTLFRRHPPVVRRLVTLCVVALRRDTR